MTTGVSSSLTNDWPVGYGDTIIIEKMKAVYIEAVGSTAPVQFDVSTLITNRLTDSLQLTAIEGEAESGHNTPKPVAVRLPPLMMILRSSSGFISCSLVSLLAASYRRLSLPSGDTNKKVPSNVAVPPLTIRLLLPNAVMPQVALEIIGHCQGRCRSERP